jgi:hypothetical protein
MRCEPGIYEKDKRFIAGGRFYGEKACLQG